MSRPEHLMGKDAGPSAERLPFEGEMGAPGICGLLSPWQVMLRRVLFFGFVVAATMAATFWLGDIFWQNGIHRAHAPMLFIFAVLHALLALGAAHVIFGQLPEGRVLGKANILELERCHPGPLGHRYAIVMPIYEEDAGKVCARIEAIFLSLQQTGQGGAFDYFILSDTRSADKWVQEEAAWASLCQRVGGFGRIFYRRRSQNTNRKAGNIADFVRTSGGAYEAMLVLDADSLMDGTDILRMARVMETAPRLAILQTPPQLINARTPFALAQQFMMALAGPCFARGLNFWQLHEGSYWGHNALIRLKPFSEYCDLPALPGREPFGGRIFSHDFVEAALLVREGWQVWLAYEVEGTFEESPPTLADHLARDRRWCQGNLQHVWLLLARKLRWTVRMHLLGGVMSYLSSPLWFAFLFFGTWLAWDRAHSGLSQLPFSGVVQRLFGISQETQVALLVTWVLILLLLPRIVSAVRVLLEPERRAQFGGGGRFLLGLAAELLLSVLLAPVMMMSHTQSVLEIIRGKSVAWNPQTREGYGTSWAQAWKFHGPAFVLGLLWAAVCLNAGEDFFLIMSPILAGLVLSPFLSVVTSRPGLGRRLLSWGLWRTPMQTQPLPVIKAANDLCVGHGLILDASHPKRLGFIAAAVDPYINSIHVSLAASSSEPGRAADFLRGEACEDAVKNCLAKGPDALSAAEKDALLRSPEAMLLLHRTIWQSGSERLHPVWLQAKESYRSA